MITKREYEMSVEGHCVVIYRNGERFLSLPAVAEVNGIRADQLYGSGSEI
jgi:hypothetical protein